MRTRRSRSSPPSAGSGRRRGRPRSAACRPRPPGSSPSNAVTIPTSGASSQSSPRPASRPSAGNAVTPTIATSTVSDDDEPDRREERARQRPTRLARLLGEVRDRLEARVGEEPEGNREQQVVDPVLPGREREPVRERLGREDEREAERRRSAAAPRGRAARPRAPAGGAATAARAGSPPITRDRADRDDDVPRRVAQPVDLERCAEVVRQEQRRERDHDQVVEKQRPARDEADEVVERTSREGLRPTGLRNRGGPFRVRERDEREDDAGEREDERRQAERAARRRFRARRRSTSRSRRRRSANSAGASRTRSKPRTFRAIYVRPAFARAGSARPRARRTGRRAANPSTPPPWAAVTTSSAIPITTNAAPNAYTARGTSSCGAPLARRGHHHAARRVSHHAVDRRPEHTAPPRQPLARRAEHDDLGAAPPGLAHDLRRRAPAPNEAARPP